MICHLIINYVQYKRLEVSPYLCIKIYMNIHENSLKWSVSKTNIIIFQKDIIFSVSLVNEMELAGNRWHRELQSIRDYYTGKSGY